MLICTFQIPMAADVSSNVSTISHCLSLAAQSQAHLAVFPEMAVVGYDSHLHGLFQQEGWYSKVQEGLETLAADAQELGLKAVIGTPFRLNGEYQNAMILVGSDSGILYAGGRKVWSKGWLRYGFTMPERKDPVHIEGYDFGFVICDEVSHLEELNGTGIEKSYVILWPSVTRNYFNSQKWGTRDNCRLDGASIARTFNAVVIQSSFSTYVHDLEDTVKLGGIVIVDSDGTILKQAPYEGEAFLTHGFGQRDT